MLNNLPVGIYLARSTPMHGLRARTKLLVLAWLAIIFFAADHRAFHYGVYGISFALLALALTLTRVSIGYIWRRMRFLTILLLIGVPFSLMFTPGDTWRPLGPLIVTIAGHTISLGPIIVTYDGIWFIMAFGSIFLLLYLGSILLSLTTTPVALAEGMVLLLRPFRRLGLPVDEFGLMTLVSLRFIPVLVQEAEQLVRAQMSRGADFTSGSLRSRIRGVGSLLVPLVQGALRRAENLSAALEARGYGIAGEATLLHEGHLRFFDWLVLIGVPLLTTFALFKL